MALDHDCSQCGRYFFRGHEAVYCVTRRVLFFLSNLDLLVITSKEVKGWGGGETTSLLVTIDVIFDLPIAQATPHGYQTSV